MRIRIGEHSDRYYAEYIGEVLMWTNKVEFYAGSAIDPKPFSVPAVLLLCDDGKIKLIALAREPYWFEIEELKNEAK